MSSMLTTGTSDDWFFVISVDVPADDANVDGGGRLDFNEVPNRELQPALVD
jgi:hypothetical protein